MLIASLLAVAALTDPEGVVTTAPARMPDLAALNAASVAEAPAPSAQDAAPHGLTTEQQIQRWIGDRAPGASFEETAVVAGPVDDRQMHGVVEAGIGTGGYRSYGAAVSLPVGENGRLDLAYREGRNEPLFYNPGYYSPGYGWSRGRGFDSSSRSMSLGYSWRQNRDSDERGRGELASD